MQHSQSQAGTFEQLWGNFFLSRGGVWEELFTIPGGPADKGKNLRGLMCSLAVYPADFKQGFGKDVVLTSTTRGQLEDLAFPVGVIMDDLVVGKDPVVNTWIRVLVYGYTDRLYQFSAGVGVYMSDAITNGPVAKAYALSELTANRRLGGSGTLLGTGVFNLTGDAAAIDWTSPGGAPFFDTLATTGLVGAASVPVPDAGLGFVGVCPNQTATTPSDAPTLTGAATSRPTFIMCMAGSAGRV